MISIYACLPWSVDHAIFVPLSWFVSQWFCSNKNKDQGHESNFDTSADMPSLTRPLLWSETQKAHQSNWHTKPTHQQQQKPVKIKIKMQITDISLSLAPAVIFILDKEMVSCGREGEILSKTNLL
jgi:hypothetical protein